MKRLEAGVMHETVSRITAVTPSTGFSRPEAGAGGSAGGSAVISVGVRNRYGHPSPRALRLLDAARVLTFRTDRDGTVEVRASRNGQVVVHTLGVAAGTARAMRIASGHFSSARTGTGSTMRSARPGCPVTQH